MLLSEMGFNCAVKGKKPAPIAQFWLATKEKKYKRVSKRKENTLGPESVFFSSPRNYYPGEFMGIYEDCCEVVLWKIF